MNLIEGLARLDLPDFELASRDDVDALGAFLEANGMTVVDPPGENITGVPTMRSTSPTPKA